MRVSSCRWCGAELVQADGPGHPRVWCDQGCARAYEAALGCRDYQADIRLVETCPCGRRIEDLKGPLLSPGAWADAAAHIASALHGHPVEVELQPVAVAFTGGTWTGGVMLRDPETTTHA